MAQLEMNHEVECQTDKKYLLKCEKIRDLPSTSFRDDKIFVYSIFSENSIFHTTL